MPLALQPRERQYILDHYRDQTIRVMAAELGRQPDCIARALHALEAAGQADPRRRCYQPAWTPEEVRTVRDLLGRGLTLEQVSKAVERTPDAINVALKRRGVRCCHKTPAVGTLSMQDVCRVMGVASPARVVLRWVRDGLLRASRCSGGKARSRWIIRPADLIRFLEAHPGVYEHWRIPERVDGRLNEFRIWARRGNPAAGYLSVKEFGRSLGMTARQVQYLIREGRLEAVHLPNTPAQWWWIPKAEVERLRQERAR